MTMSEAQQTRPKVLAAIPCFNTEPFIADVVSNARKYVDQVVVINDGSHDGTAEAARTAGALVINHGANRGYGEAIKSCFEAAKANAADVLVTLDGDAQHNPGEIPKLLAPILKGEADLIIGSRFLSSQGNMPKYRRFGIRVITFLFNFGSKTKVSDAQSGFRAYSRKMLNAISVAEGGMSISVETLIKARAGGFGIKEVPASCRYHPGSSSINPITHGLAVALSVVRIRLKNGLHSLIRGSNARNQGS
ncbi:glycosyltransferase family 2 protein [Dehalococcoidia bacterium]|nr:glycosyltransferase family 2 protein [Dehalococcoidia bacterium]